MLKINLNQLIRHYFKQTTINNMEKIIKNADGSTMARFTEKGYLLIGKKFTESYVGHKRWEVKESIERWSKLMPFEATHEEFHSALLQTINELTIELHNVSKSFKNDFIETQQIKSDCE